MGSIETVTVTMNGVPSMGARGVGVTQGELLRQEQQAGVVPVSQLVPNHHHPIHSAHRVAAAAAAAAAATSSSSPSTAATEGSASERNSSIYAAAEQAIESGEAVGSVSGADEEEKPHARGPDEIGPADIGSQREGTASTHYVGGGPGVEMQGINLEAAVGRKANEKHTSASPDPPKKADDDAVEKEVEDGGAGGGDDDDKMEGVEVTTRARSSTPKREADEGLEGVAKKLKEDGDAADAPKRADGDTDDAGTEIPVSDAKAGEDSAGSD
ncbi:hypothetical protein BX600DRAFT_447958 [Xylariales sp. PMI_506]|nr:hypothetical protein BX600DRAFT_447958 [Xylariales sp. PMI_506]